MPKINHRSLPEKTADAIIDYIRTSDLRAGEKLPNENELSVIFEVSRNTIRAAIKLLVQKDVIEVQRGSGTFISKKMGISDDPLGLSLIYDKRKMAKDLIQLRVMIEPKMASLAAQYCTPREGQQLLALCEEMEQLFKEDKCYRHKDQEFHTLIANYSRNSVIHHLIPTIHQALVLQDNLGSPKLGAKSMKYHRIIAEAIIEHRGSDAFDAMHSHLIHNEERIKQSNT